MLLAVTGFVMIFLIIFLLLQSKAHPTPIFVIVPILCAVVCGFDFTQIAEFMKTGVTTTMPVAVLFIFSSSSSRSCRRSGSSIHSSTSS